MSQPTTADLNHFYAAGSEAIQRLQAENERLRAIIDDLVAALRKIPDVPRQRPSSDGPLYGCEWCNGSADIARAAIARAKESK